MAATLAFPAHSALPITLDVKEDEQCYIVRADIPGVRQEDIEIAVDGNEVTLRAETLSSVMSRSFPLHGEVDSAAARAQYRDGVLEVLLRKKS